MRARLQRLLTVAAATLGAAGCLPGPSTFAIQRASREFGCSGDKVTIVQRGDISDALYDIAACGHRARYSCFWVDVDSAAASVHCVREPDPPASDLDPVALASLPRPVAAASPSNVLRICGSDDGDCLERVDGSWRWRPARYQQSQCGGAPCW